MRFPLSFLFSRLNKPSLPSRPFTIYVAFPWILSNSFMFLHCTWGEAVPAHSRVGKLLTNCYRLAMLCLMYPKIWLAILAVKAHCWLKFNLTSTRIPRSLSMKLLSTQLYPACTCIQGCHDSGAEYSTLFKFQVVGDCPALSFVKIFLQGLFTLWGFNSSC